MKNILNSLLKTTVLVISLTLPFISSAQWSGTPTEITAGTVGIGTTTPTGKLELRFAGSLKGFTITSDRSTSCAGTPCPPDAYFQIRDLDALSNFTTHLIYDANKNFGIGTATPLGKLHINGATSLYLERPGTTWSSTKVKVGISTNIGLPGLRFEVSDNSGATFTDALHISNNGIIGMGTTNPNSNSRLTVNGNLVITDNTGAGQAVIYSNGYIRARELQIDVSLIPDYVFDTNYNLMSLKDLKKYLAENKHLPNIPSALEYNDKGNVSVGELQMLLLEKVEELTLYILQQQAEIDELKCKLE